MFRKVFDIFSLNFVCGIYRTYEIVILCYFVQVIQLRLSSTQQQSVGYNPQLRAKVEACAIMFPDTRYPSHRHYALL